MKVPAGCVVAPVVSSANHDEAVFDNPEVFDIRRTALAERLASLR